VERLNNEVATLKKKQKGAKVSKERTRPCKLCGGEHWDGECKNAVVSSSNSSNKSDQKYINIHSYISRGSQKTSMAVGQGTFYPYKKESSNLVKPINILYISTDFYPYFIPVDSSTDDTGYDLSLTFQKFIDEFISKLPLPILEKINLKQRPAHAFKPIQLTYQQRSIHLFFSQQLHQANCLHVA
jgi:hypothetical protein